MVLEPSRVRRLWVIRINWVCLPIVSRTARKRSTFASSRVVSTSSSTQNGVGLTRRMANTKAQAVRERSPPDSRSRLWGRLPGGRATISIPVLRISSISVIESWAVPPWNRSLKKCTNSLDTASNVRRSSRSMRSSSSRITRRKSRAAFSRSSDCASRKPWRCAACSYSCAASGFTLLNRRKRVRVSCTSAASPHGSWSTTGSWATIACKGSGG